MACDYVITSSVSRYISSEAVLRFEKPKIIANLVSWCNIKLLQFGKSVMGSIASPGTPPILCQGVSNTSVAGTRWTLSGHTGTIRGQIEWISLYLVLP